MLNFSSLFYPKNKGFTLIELLVVLTIIGILALTTVLLIDPLEISRKSRDTVRVADIHLLNQAITAAVQEASPSATSIVLCTNTTIPCSGSSSPLLDNTRKSDGTGWVKVDVFKHKTISLPVLPVDPLNQGVHFYTYSTNIEGTAWELNAVFESKEYRLNKKYMEIDGGDNNDKYELGSNLRIIH